MKTNVIKLLLCCMFASLLIVSQTMAQVRPLVGSGAPNPPGPISGPTSVSTATSQYSVPAIVPGIYNSNGDVLRSAKNKNGNSSITFPTGDIANGNYFLHIIQGSKTIEKHIVIQH